MRGVCASRGCAIGVARVVRGTADLARIQSGEIAVLSSAWPAAGDVLGRVGAIVAERGGALCSLGTLAREGAVPCVVGATGATEVIRDGDVVFVDADEGFVLVFEPVVAAPI